MPSPDAAARHTGAGVARRQAHHERMRDDRRACSGSGRGRSLLCGEKDLKHEFHTRKRRQANPLCCHSFQSHNILGGPHHLRSFSGLRIRSCASSATSTTHLCVHALIQMVLAAVDDPAITPHWTGSAPNVGLGRCRAIVGIGARHKVYVRTIMRTDYHFRTEDHAQLALRGRAMEVRKELSRRGGPVLSHRLVEVALDEPFRLASRNAVLTGAEVVIATLEHTVHWERGRQQRAAGRNGAFFWAPKERRRSPSRVFEGGNVGRTGRRRCWRRTGQRRRRWGGRIDGREICIFEGRWSYRPKCEDSEVSEGSKHVCEPVAPAPQEDAC